MIHGFMSFELPRANRLLRFTGEVQSLPLGKKRPPAPPPSSKKDVYEKDPAPTPYFAARPSVRAELAARNPFDSLDDENAVTRAMPRDEFDSPKTQKPPKHAALGVPNFRRSAAPPEPVIIVPRFEKRTARQSSASLALLVWAFIAIIGGAISYRFAPAIVENVKTAVQVLE
jgi:hypothetical protein